MFGREPYLEMSYPSKVSDLSDKDRRDTMSTSASQKQRPECTVAALELGKACGESLEWDWQCEDTITKPEIVSGDGCQATTIRVGCEEDSEPKDDYQQAKN